VGVHPHLDDWERSNCRAASRLGVRKGSSSLADRRAAPLQVALDPAGKFPWWSWSVAVCSGRVRWRCGRLTIRWISECLEDGGVVGYVYVRPVLVFEIPVLASQLTDGQSW